MDVVAVETFLYATTLEVGSSDNAIRLFPSVPKERNPINKLLKNGDIFIVH